MNIGRLHGKRAFVTAAANGIGRETALAFAREGAEVLAVDINDVDLRTLAAQSERIATQVLDVTEAQSIAELIESRPFDVVFNCAGWVHQGTIGDCDDSAWRRSFAVNVDSMFYVCRAAIPRMIADGGGSIINMSSVASSIKGARNRFAYGASKAAVIGLTKSIAADYASQRIRCNAVCPGTVETPSLLERVAALGGSADEVWQSFIDRQPLGRLGKVSEIAAVAVYLASDESAFTTGSAVVVDGGWSN
ncbi:MAG TPA: SDR family oxidoreductase [Steroidobacteraceae bacterium]|jgi:2-keto-3-deoxy-L-fuconate dehydrogenase